MTETPTGGYVTCATPEVGAVRPRSEAARLAVLPQAGQPASERAQRGAIATARSVARSARE